MRLPLLSFVVVAVTAALGYALCRAAGLGVDVRAMLVAAGVCLVASLAASMPLRVRSSDAGLVTQASLLATGIHLLVAVALVAVVMLSHWAGASFVYWVMPFFWVTLAALAVECVRAVRRAALPAIHS